LRLRTGPRVKAEVTCPENTEVRCPRAMRESTRARCLYVILTLPPPDPACIVCSKPIEPGSLVVYQRDRLRISGVASRWSKALQDVDRAQTW
jgi:hypothetical protein